MVDGAITSLVAQCLNDSSVSNIKQLQRECSSYSRNLLAKNRLVLPTDASIVYKKFNGEGSISFSKTHSEFCLHGRNFDNIIGRQRVKSMIKLNIMIVYDDSNSMTGWWRKERFGSAVAEEESPQTIAKLAALLILEGYGRDADVRLISFGNRASDPFTKREIIYNELVRKNGSGGTRLDLALGKLIRLRWAKEGGVNILVIISDGLPETGWKQAGAPYLTETKEGGISDQGRQRVVDAKVQNIVLRQLRQLISEGVYVMYIPIFSDDRLASWVSGKYSARTLAREFEMMGITVVPVLEGPKMPETVFKGLHELSTTKIVASSDQRYFNRPRN
ncbi:MAG: vWA domain-containing protein [Halobacteriota archaeon]|nr:vWA domain-containing protein [Halobacteriota archaeon]